ncbi:receptor-like serine/threonine-protein kinase ncrk [Phtheirospermum japonicum]|uniref:Receptor-like serine/threonine-protein kinase ncrk n=1 Tax=Phtheirospermum japonicum TaxID=374723 RepID=A0A830CXU6_9LAMI|nr:receptor-like serine/threonine-protein kinase ncrk [Phtheirospermum japonicum]
MKLLRLEFCTGMSNPQTFFWTRNGRPRLLTLACLNTNIMTVSPVVQVLRLECKGLLVTLRPSTQLLEGLL